MVENLNIEYPEYVSDVRKAIELFSIRQNSDASEILVNIIKSKLIIKTIRSDEKREMWVYEDGIYVPKAVSYIKESLRILLGKAYTSPRVNSVLEKIEADTYIDPTDFFRNDYPFHMPVENGVLNLKTKKLEEFNPKKIFFIKIPVKYDKTKTCKHWLNHLKAVVGNPEEDITVLSEIFGHGLIKKYYIEKGAVFEGNGRNGKSKTLEVLKMFVGATNTSNISLHRLETDRFAMSELHGKLFNLIPDLESTALKNTANFKSLTGGDHQNAARKHLPDITFVNVAKFIISANNLPKSYDTSVGFWERWVLIKFPYTFIPKKDYEKLNDEEKKTHKIAKSNIIEKLTTPNELSGILNWALEGLDRIMKKNSFSSSMTTEEIKNYWIRKADSFRAFLEDCVEIVEDPLDTEGNISKEDLRSVYAKYCRSNRLKTEGDTAIKITLMEWGVSDRRFNEFKGKTKVSIWEGIRFKTKREK